MGAYGQAVWGGTAEVFLGEAKIASRLGLGCVRSIGDVVDGIPPTPGESRGEAYARVISTTTWSERATTASVLISTLGIHGWQPILAEGLPWRLW